MQIVHKDDRQDRHLGLVRSGRATNCFYRDAVIVVAAAVVHLIAT